MKEKVGPVTKKGVFLGKTKGKAEKRPRNFTSMTNLEVSKQSTPKESTPRSDSLDLGLGLELSKSPLVTKLVGLETEDVSNDCEGSSAVGTMTTELALWPADGILRQALMSFTYSDQDENPSEKSHEVVSEDLHSSIPDCTGKVLSLPNQSLKLVPLSECSSNVKSTVSTSMSETVSNVLPCVIHLPVPLNQLNFLSGKNSTPLSLASLPEVTIPCTTDCNLLAASDESIGLSRKSTPFTTLPSTVSQQGLTTLTIPEVSPPLMKDVHSFPAVTMTSPNSKTLSLPVPLSQSGISLATLKNNRPILATIPSKEGMVALVYSTIPTIGSMTYTNESQYKIAPLPPMSDLKLNRSNRINVGSQKSSKSEIQSQLSPSLDDFLPPKKTTLPSLDHSSLITTSEGTVFTNASIMLTQSPSAISHSVSHLIQPFLKSFPEVPSAASNPLPSTLAASTNGNILVSTSSFPATSTVSPITVQTNSKRIKSIQEILDSQSNGTIYTTSLTSVPIMALPNTLNHNLNLSSIQSPSTLSEESLLTRPTPTPSSKANAQLHALLNNNSSSSSSNSGSPSLNALLNNAVSSNRNPESRPVATTIAHASPFYAPSTCPGSPTLHSQDSTVYTAPSYAVQSPAEILSQLKAGVLPTMSSSQVSSVLSALASDSSCAMEIDNDSTHHEIISGQVLHLPTTPVDKVSTLTQTEDLDLPATFSVHHRSDKSDKHVCLKNPSDDTMIAQVMSLLNREEAPSTPDGKHAAPASLPLPVNHLLHETRVNLSQSLFIKQEMLESSNHRTNFSLSNAKGIQTAIRNIENFIMDDGIGSSVSEPMCDDRADDDVRDGSVVSPQELCRVTGKPNGVVLDLAHLNSPPDDEEVESRVCLEIENQNLIEQVSCFKCTFCSYLNLDRAVMTKHIIREHNREIPGTQQHRLKLKCPGCPNIFFQVTSLKVHLVQDHEVSGSQLSYFLQMAVTLSETQKTASKYKTAEPISPNLKGPSQKVVVPKQAVLCISKNVVPNFEPKETVDMPLQPNLGSTLLNSDCLKIRVRNLDKETHIDDVPASLSDVDDCALDDSFHENVLSGNDDSSNGAMDLDHPDGIVMDDDPLTKRLKPTVEPCEYKDVKGDLTTLVVCGTSAEEPPPPPSKKRGRPRGSRNQPPSAHKKPVSEQEVASDKDSGYKCDVDSCAVRLKSHDNIEYHRRCHNQAGYICPECSLDVLHWNNLLSHLWRVHGIDMELYSCDQCGYKTNSYSKLTNLHVLIHSEERPFLCDTCGKGFKNPKQLRNHKAIHIAKAKAKAGGSVGDCEICGRTFSSVRLLRLHQDNVHRKLRPYLCNFCGYSASSRSTLKMHMRQHTGEKPFECDECSYRTADHNSLRRHKMRHSGDKPYKCPHCNYACIQSSTFKAHLKSKHPGLDTGLMFSCPLCSFRSVKNENYLAHLAEHELGMRLAMPGPCAKKSRGGKEKREDKAPDTDSDIPVIVDLVVTPGEPTPDTTLTTNLQLVYNEGQTERLFSQPSPVIMSTKTLEVRTKNLGHSTPTHALNEAAIEVGSRQLSEFEAEEITGDIREMNHVSEQRELKFKVGQE